MTFREWIVTVAASVVVLQWLLIPHLLAQRCKSPNSTLAWLWTLIFVPGTGVLYLLIGNERVQRKRLALVRALDSQLAVTAGTSRKRRAMLAAAMPELERVNGMPVTAGNTAALLPDGTCFFPVLLELIGGAKHHLHLEFYIWRNDRAGIKVRDALVKAAQQGVQVRVIVDEIGSFFLRRSFFAPLIAAGGAFSWFNSFLLPRRGRFHLNLRNHRKLIVADGLVALTGGINIGDEYWRGAGALPYRDLGVKLTGPIVGQLQEVFAQDWYFSTGQPLTAEEYYPPIEPCGEVGAQVVAGAPDNDIDEVQLSTIAVLHRAEKRIRIITPYFVPEKPLLAALQLAAMRGVDVALLMPEKCDRFYLTHVMRSYYDDLLPHGIRILEYQPRMIHAKSLTVDGMYTMAGSANFDIRSLRINFELNVLLTCRHTTQSADHFFDSTAAEARPVTLEEYQRRPLRHKIAEAVFRPLAPLL